MEGTVTFLRFWLQVFGGMYGVMFVTAITELPVRVKVNKYMRALLLFMLCELAILLDLYSRYRGVKEGFALSDIVVYTLTGLASFNLICNYIYKRETSS